MTNSKLLLKKKMRFPLLYSNVEEVSRKKRSRKQATARAVALHSAYAHTHADLHISLTALTHLYFFFLAMLAICVYCFVSPSFLSPLLYEVLFSKHNL